MCRLAARGLRTASWQPGPAAEGSSPSVGHSLPVPVVVIPSPPCHHRHPTHNAHPTPPHPTPHAYPCLTTSTTSRARMRPRTADPCNNVIASHKAVISVASSDTHDQVCPPGSWAGTVDGFTEQSVDVLDVGMSISHMLMSLALEARPSGMWAVCCYTAHPVLYQQRQVAQQGCGTAGSANCGATTQAWQARCAPPAALPRRCCALSRDALSALLLLTCCACCAALCRLWILDRTAPPASTSGRPVAAWAPARLALTARALPTTPASSQGELPAASCSPAV